MDIYKVVLKPTAPFSSALYADTLFGTICWAIRYTEGEDALLFFLECYKEGEPDIILSDLFPDNLLPIPLRVEKQFADEENDKQFRLEQYKKYKQLKKQTYTSLEGFNIAIQGGVPDKTDGDGLLKQITYGNMVDRRYGTVTASEGPGLYSREEIYTDRNMCFYVKIADGCLQSFKKRLTTALNLGIGGKKSIGRGDFKLISFERFTGFTIPPNPNGFVLLSSCIPAENDPIQGNYSYLVKYGKLDREFAASESPFKKPLLMLKAGSVFFDPTPKEYYGRMVDNVSALSKDILHYGLGFAVPILVG